MKVFKIFYLSLKLKKGFPYWKKSWMRYTLHSAFLDYGSWWTDIKCLSLSPSSLPSCVFPSAIPFSLPRLQRDNNNKWFFIVSLLFHLGQPHEDLQVWREPSPGACCWGWPIPCPANSTSPEGERFLELDIPPPRIFSQESWRTPLPQKTHKKICA